MPQRNCKIVHRLSNLECWRRSFHQFWALVIYVDEGKSLKSEASSGADSNASKIDEFEDLYKEIWQKH
jgi:hypothetical protein